MEEDERPAPVETPAPRYRVLTITAPPEAAEAVAALLHEAHTGGLVEEAAAPGLLRLRAYLREDGAAEGVLETLRARLRRLPSFGLGEAPPELTVEVLANEAWATVWKEHFHAFPVGRRLWVVPSWEPPPADREVIPIFLDPGMAFGSGLHPSTQLCLRLLEEYLRPNMLVADLGTGSGILAIAAAKLGAGRVLAVDNDPLAVRVAKANALRNQVGGTVTVVVGDLLSPLSAPVDLIVANLTADIVAGIAPLVAPHLAPGGLLIASGIVDTRVYEVRAALERHGLTVESEVVAEEWRALIAAAE